jgi:hypothetical protein
MNTYKVTKFVFENINEPGNNHVVRKYITVVEHQTWGSAKEMQKKDHSLMIVKEK